MVLLALIASGVMQSRRMASTWSIICRMAMRYIYISVYMAVSETQKVPAAEPRGAVRVRLESTTHVVDINGPAICEVLDQTGLLGLIDRIGPDVLRSDADP